MAAALKIGFSPLQTAPKGTVVAFCGEGLRFGPATQKTLAPVADTIARAAATARFKGASGSAIELLAPAGLAAERLVVIGTGKGEERTEMDALKLGGIALGKIGKAAEAMILAETAEGIFTAAEAADLALGAQLRAYEFDRYKTKKKDGEDARPDLKLTIAAADVAAVRRAWARRDAVAGGVRLARDLVNEPPNVLFPMEFARRCMELKKLGVTVEVLDVKAMQKLGMNALLGVGQGSAHDSRLVVMRWNGGRKGEAPVSFIGKGVCFDTGGISIKPAGGMEDMKGDMAGAAAVTGLMHALAARKAKVNVVGAIGVVENMPDGRAQRPGDIVTAMSGQTIEIINTDAEGRLVLADVLWYVAKRFKPKFMVDLATLTGAIIISLGSEHAGLFSNDDTLSERLTAAGLATGEKLWRMPLSKSYDKLIDSKFADVKNTGGRPAGSITAAQFLQRFVADNTPWAHLDIAGTGMGSPQTDINKSWGSGFGVRLLDRLVADHYEA
ncbi:MAG TPA: leucyl aminopeptidase [Xanthobacteraceae bacterium]|nr:leucyl aminopeptidase [Xanthobacteraceae bacterium]